jgi:hypothetical protein
MRDFAMNVVSLGVECPDFAMENFVAREMAQVGPLGTLEQFQVAALLVDQGEGLLSALSRSTAIRPPRAPGPRPPAVLEKDLRLSASSIHASAVTYPLPGRGLCTLGKVPLHPVSGTGKHMIIKPIPTYTAMLQVCLRVS